MENIFSNNRAPEKHFTRESKNNGSKINFQKHFIIQFV